MSYISGNITFVGNSANCSAETGQIGGLAIFCDASINCGYIRCSFFLQTSSNLGVVYNTTFSGNSVNYGSVVGSGLFFGASVNSGIISGNAIFADTSINSGTVQGNANFAIGASNQGGFVSGSTGTYTPPSSFVQATSWRNYSDRCWFNLNNWFNNNYITTAECYPISSTNVIMSGSCAASTPLNCNLWVKPASINTTLITDPSGIYFYSATGFVLSGINICGNATFGLNTTLI